MIQFLKNRHNSAPFVINRAMSHTCPALLIPSKEKLELLQDVDLFSSFNDSQEVIHIDTDSDDPFDPADLMGLETLWAIRQSTSPNRTSPLNRISPTIRGNSSATLPMIWLRTSSPRPVKDLPNTLRSPQAKADSTSLVTLSCARDDSPALEYATARGDNYTCSPSPKPSTEILRRVSPNLSPTRFPKQEAVEESLIPSVTSDERSLIKIEQETLSLRPETNELIEVTLKTEPDLSSASLKRPWYLLLPRNTTTISAPRQPKAAPKVKIDLTATIQLATQAEPLGNTLSINGKFVKPILLSREQEYVRQLAMEGKSMFFTGSAGTGKSVLLRQIMKDLKDRHGPKTVAVTASTGLSAYNIGGITVHSFAGIGLGNGDLANLIEKVKRNRKVLQRWRDTKALIIDEISMIDGRLFDNLDAIARAVRRRQRHLPFGGIQVIVCGDFYQLPPVSKAIISNDGTEYKEQAVFAFESLAWREALSSSIILKEVFRQKGDQTFVDMLNDLRHGHVSEEADTEFRRLSRPLVCPLGLVPTELYATRREVENANNMKLLRLGGMARVYEARDGGTLPPAVRNAWISNFLAPKKLFLKENAQVMCIKNYDDTLVNGSLGRVKAFVDRDTYLCRKIMEENSELPLSQIKKIFAKHKVAYSLSQQSQEEVLIDDITDEMLEAAPRPLDSVFDFLHEDKNFEDVLGIKEGADDSAEEIVRQNKRRKLDFISQVEKMAQGEMYPLVEFASPDGLSSRTVLIEPERWDVTDEETEEVLVSRLQLPLMLAWAMSIHKSQGQTLPKVKVDLSRIFENGHAYVALSRAVSREGLQVVNFRADRVRTHEVVEQFYETLSTTEDLKKTDL